MASASEYWKATRHPGPSLLFLLPLLAAYELGVLYLGGTQPQTLRNGADAWLRWGLEAFGLDQMAVAPALVVVIVIVWCVVRRDDRPGELGGLCLGMAIESVAGALALWGLSRGFGPLLDHLGVKLAAPPTHALPPAGMVVTFVGAGIYEETLFRLVLFSGLSHLLRLALVPTWIAHCLAATAASLTFAAAHHLGPYGEPLDGYVFVFRTLAGLYFTVIYQLRGFGIAVGAHACYDVLVGVAM
jgi:membrane protease YdiL (CAAX protease family)